MVRSSSVGAILSSLSVVAWLVSCRPTLGCLGVQPSPSIDVCHRHLHFYAGYRHRTSRGRRGVLDAHLATNLFFPFITMVLPPFLGGIVLAAPIRAVRGCRSWVSPHFSSHRRSYAGWSHFHVGCSVQAAVLIALSRLGADIAYSRWRALRLLCRFSLWVSASSGISTPG